MIEPPDDAGRRLVFLVNTSAGGVTARRSELEDLVSRCRDAGYAVTPLFLPADELDDAGSKLPSEPSLVVVCGGDGTIRSTFERLAVSDHSLAVLPLGTVNVFARSLGLSMALDEALAQILSGEDRQLDAARLNDRLFLNTFLLGLYPRLAEIRESRRARHAHWPRWLRWLVDSSASAGQVLINWRRYRFVLELDGEPLVGKAVTFAITNNEKSVPPGPSSFDKGELVVYIPRPVSRAGLIKLMLQAVFSHPPELEPLRVHKASSMQVRVPDGTPYSIDGEVDEISGDIRVEILPRHCRVRVPVGEASR